MTDQQQLPGGNPPPPLYRWAILVFIGLAMFGNYYVYDSVAPVFDLLKDQLGFSDQQLGALYSVYSVAAIIVLLIGGYLIDRYGTRNSILVFSVICLIAAGMTAFSSGIETMIAGRFVLGLGSEPLIVAGSTALAKWFRGKELSFAFGLKIMIARLGSVAADLSPAWARPFYATWQDPLWLATGIAGISVATCTLYWILERRAEERQYVGTQQETEKFEIKGLFRFSASYWYIVALCVVFYSTVFPFRAFAIKYFIEAHGTSREVGGLLNSFLPVAAMIATPLFGFLVDRIGKRSFFMMFGSLLLLPQFLMATYLPAGTPLAVSLPLFGQAEIPLTLLVIMFMLGIAFSLIPAVLWPSVAYIVDQSRMGTAFSVMTLCQQLGMAAIPWLIGVLNDAFAAGPGNPGGYAPGMWVFTGLSSLGLLFSFLLWRVERGPKSHGLETITTKTGVS